MDTAKGIGMIINNPEFADVRSLEGVAPTKNRCVPIFAVPTTAGTAAEVTINYVITDVEKNRKMVCVDPKDIPVVAFVDPEMMSTMPKGLTAATGMDALTHAIEGYITAGTRPVCGRHGLLQCRAGDRPLHGSSFGSAVRYSSRRGKRDHPAYRDGIQRRGDRGEVP